MKLSRRLQAIYNLVNSPCILADIGCDHALLPIALVQGEKSNKVYACDVNEGPLQRGAKAIEDAGLSNQIQTILTNGLRDVPNDVTCITIAGMGCETMLSILEHDIDQVRGCKQVILQSNNHIELLRQWISDHGFTIDAEDLVYEQHYYFILSIHNGEEKLSDHEIKYGKYLDHHPLIMPYWIHILNKKRVILDHLDTDHDMYPTIVAEMNEIESYLQTL